MSEMTGGLAVESDVDAPPAPPPFATTTITVLGEPAAIEATAAASTADLEAAEPPAPPPASSSAAVPVARVGAANVAASPTPPAEGQPPAAMAPPPASDAGVEPPSAAKTSLIESMGAYLTSMVVHLVLFVILAATLGTMQHFTAKAGGDAPSFTEIMIDEPGELIELKPFKLEVQADLEPSKIDDTVEEPVAIAPREAKFYNNDDEFSDGRGGFRDHDTKHTALDGDGVRFKLLGPGAASQGLGGYGKGGKGDLDLAGEGGGPSGFGLRSGHDEGTIGRMGGTQATERGVAAALNWLARHQNLDGSWSLDRYTKRCKGGICSGHSQIQADAAATALGLLPFLGAGHTHKAKLRDKDQPVDKEKDKILKDYQERVNRGLSWLVRHQNTVTGDLSAGTQHVMYTHGLATIALCEAYAMTGDERIGRAAQYGVDFIVKTQSKQLGGWRYVPGDFDSDTSVVGWQLMALKSAQMAKLQVPQQTLEGVAKWLNTVSSGNYGGQFAYRMGQEPSPSMTSVGMLCREYLGAPHDADYLQEGRAYLLKNLPSHRSERNIYYWYYATQAMHHMMGPEWDKWNRAIRRELVETQVAGKAGCAVGSWDPQKPSSDEWGERGGRLMMTSLSCLTLEVYYRYLPLYDLDSKPKKKADANDPAKNASGEPGKAAAKN
jgi:hypothetical protein